MKERANVKESDPAEIVRAKIADLMESIALEGWEERSEQVARALLGVEREDEPHLEGEEFQGAAIELVVGSTLAQGGRRLIVFEDLHWCDHASLELVRATTELVAENPIVVLASFRPDREADLVGVQGVGGDRARGACHGARAGLPLGGAERRADRGLPPGPGDDGTDRQRILRNTEGNPLFLQEVAQRADRRRRRRAREGGWRMTADTAEIVIPDTIQSLITVGLDRLPGRLVGRADGRRDRADLRGGAPRRRRRPAEVRDDLRELVRRDLIRVPATARRAEFTFRHALTQEAAYGTLLAKHRRATHRRVAEVLEETAGERLDDVAPQLVRHFSEAGEDGSTVTYAAKAGDAAARLYANAEAEAHYRTGLDAARRIAAPTSSSCDRCTNGEAAHWS